MKAAFVLMFIAFIVMDVVVHDQDATIIEQRALIHSMMTDPNCMAAPQPEKKYDTGEPQGMIIRTPRYAPASVYHVVVEN